MEIANLKLNLHTDKKLQRFRSVFPLRMFLSWLGKLDARKLMG
jgi:hypothetical protein